MKIFLLLLANYCLFASPLFGQGSFTGASTTNQLFSMKNKTTSLLPNIFSGATTTFKYYDETLPTYDWIVGATYSPYTMLYLGERISLPTSTGWVDSVEITFGSVSSDSITIALLPDTLYEIQPGTTYHLMNIFTQDAIPYYELRIATKDIVLGKPTMLHFPHVLVGKEFFVAPTIEFDPATVVIFPYSIRSDREPTRDRNTQNARSAAIGIANQLTYSLITDGSFIPSGDSIAIYSNFYILAFVELGPLAVRQIPINNNQLSVYPNPCSAQTQLHLKTTTTSTMVELIDVCGRTVFQNIFSGEQTTLDCSSLPAGIYRVVCKSTVGTISSTISVVH